MVYAPSQDALQQLHRSAGGAVATTPAVAIDAPPVRCATDQGPGDSADTGTNGGTPRIAGCDRPGRGTNTGTHHRPALGGGATRNEKKRNCKNDNARHEILPLWN